MVSTRGEPETVMVSDTAPTVISESTRAVEADRQPHALAPDVLKAPQLEEDGIDANQQRRQAITPLGRRDADHEGTCNGGWSR